jgi:hypothetical protein
LAYKSVTYAEFVDGTSASMVILSMGEVDGKLS